MDLIGKSNEEIKELIVAGKVKNADLTDAGICPTCFDKENGHVLYGDNTDKIIYEDDLFECFLVGNPRANGHTAISTKKHSKKVMNALKKVYKSESVYLCTMCDGPMNHFHVQLIPRYSFEERGSKNFVKKRFDFVEDKGKLEELRKLLKK